ncbi:MAG: hypothetical protein WC508_05070 [Patescibacteria group bacterium]
MHGQKGTFQLLELNAHESIIGESGDLKWLKYPETYKAMCQCIEKVFKEYEDLLKLHLKRLQSKLNGIIPNIDFDSSWDLRGDERLSCYSTATNLGALKDILGISDLEAKRIREKVSNELYSREKRQS